MQKLHKSPKWTIELKNDYGRVIDQAAFFSNEKTATFEMDRLRKRDAHRKYSNWQIRKIK
jgi:hypothetical protein